ncbi:MAG: MMPL family transporter [Phycisphaeraceae bacterium]|nr:MMPL family transporter [Phycisphaeraceae bacterium]
MVQNRRYHLLGTWARLVAHRPKMILLLALLLAGVSVVVTVCKLEFQPNRNDLISPQLSWNKVFIDWQSAFPGSRDLVVVVDSGPKISPLMPHEKSPAQPAWENEALARKFVSQLAPKLDALPLTGQVTSTLNTADFTPKAIRLAPWDTFNAQLDQIKQSQTLLFSSSPSDLLARTIIQIRQAVTSDNQSDTAGQQGLTHRIKQFDQLIQSYHHVLAGQNTTLPMLAQVSADMPAIQYLTSPNGRLYFIRITPLPEIGKLNAFEGTINAIQHEIDSLLTQPEFNKNLGGNQSVPEEMNFRGQVGLTGIEVVEGQETAIATRDSTISSIIASVLIAILLMLAFHSVRGPLLAMIALFIGIAWSFGVLTITIGHLQVISVVFTIILLGLGIDFAVHLKSSFENLRHDHDDSEEGFSDALVQTFRITGPGILTGALTTAAAFMTTMLTDFTGVAEMGFIAGVGVLLCLLAMFSVYPALLRLVKPGHEHFKPMDDRKLHFFETRWVMPFARHPILTVTVAIFLTVISSVYVYSRVQFDYDLLKLQPVNAPAMNWAKRIMTDGGESIYFGVSVCKNIEQARQRIADFAKLPLVQPTFGGIGLLFPPDEQTKIDAITKLKAPIASVLNPKLITDSRATPQQIEQLQTQLQALQLAINGASLFKMPDAFKQQIKAVGQSVMALNMAMSQWETVSLPKRVGQLNQWFNGLQINVAQKVNNALDTSPLTPADVPQELLRAYHDDAGRWTLEVYPKLSAGLSPLSPEFLPVFVEQMQQVDSKVTGVLMQIYQSGMLIRDAYVKAGVLALVIVFVIVLIDFRNVHDALLVLLPVAVGFSLTFAIMLLVGMQINPANIIVLPLMFGIGVDSGVHVLHRYRQHPEDDPPGLTQATGKGITITTLTTVIGFACMMFAEHRGIRSLGFVVSLGLIMTLLACWTVMPAWLVLAQRIRGQRAKQS